MAALHHACACSSSLLSVQNPPHTIPPSWLCCMQGAFVLLGTTPQAGVSIVILLVMMVALLAYITWRMWEGLAGQGYDDT